MTNGISSRIPDNTDSQRDPSQEHNQLRPASLRSNGMELDAGCGSVEQASGGLGLDHAFKILDQKEKS